MANQSASAAAEKKTRVDKALESLKKPSGKLRHIHIKPADNGYSMEIDREHPAAAQNISDPPPQHVVFSGNDAKQQLLDHVGKHLD